MSINVTSLIIAMFGVLKIILSIALHEILGNINLLIDKNVVIENLKKMIAQNCSFMISLV